MDELDPNQRVSRRRAVNKLSTVTQTKTDSATSRTKGSKDRDKLSKASKVQASRVDGAASEIRYDLVNKLRDVLDKGSYEVNTREIADKIIQKIRGKKPQS